jgi:hypothetical protein
LGISPGEFPRDDPTRLCRYPPEAFMRWLVLTSRINTDKRSCGD